MKLSTLASVTLLTVGSAATFAQDAAPAADQYDTSAHASFSTADTDKDGKLSIAELQVVLPDVTINDTDADGYISQAEAEASISGLALEGDATGTIGATEYDAIVALQDDGGDAAAGADVDLDVDVDADVDTDTAPAGETEN